MTTHDSTVRPRGRTTDKPDAQARESRPYLPRLRVGLATIAASLFLFVTTGDAGEMKAELKLLQPKGKPLRTLFEAYGYQTRRSINAAPNLLRFWLPGGVKETVQTGIYSYFALAGDCEVVLTYELLDLREPEGGYGSGVGVAFDVDGDEGRGMIQRVHKGKEGHGYLFSAGLKNRKKELKEEYKFVPTEGGWGRMGIRRIKKELVFLATEKPGADLSEIGRMPFTEQTIRPLRLFADPGNSPTWVDVRVSQIDVRAEEITGGVSVTGRKSFAWWWWLSAPVGAVMLYGVWRWWRADEEEKPVMPSRRPALKRS
jgi:hypothetical protein